MSKYQQDYGEEQAADEEEEKKEEEDVPSTKMSNKHNGQI